MLEKFFKGKLYLKNQLKWWKKKFAAPVVIFLVNRISGNKSIFLFGLTNERYAYNGVVSFFKQSVQLGVMVPRFSKSFAKKTLSSDELGLIKN